MSTIEIAEIFSCLPPEILINILIHLEDKEICRISQVCKRLHAISCSDEIWKAKIIQRYPSALQSLKAAETVADWLQFYRVCKQISKTVHEQLAHLCLVGYSHMIENHHLTLVQSLTRLHPQALCLVVDELMNIVQSNGDWKDLTRKYYSGKVLTFVRHKIMKDQVLSFLSLPEAEQHMEIGACLVSQWFQTQKNIQQAEIIVQLDKIADRVREFLRAQNPTHPACFRVNSISGFSEDLWSPVQCMEILQAINTVLYQHLGFAGNTADYYHCHNSYIDLVLQNKMGIPITMCVIYGAVARRLGVVCEPVNFPVHFLLRWKKHPLAPAQYTFIDAFGKGEMKTLQQCVDTFLREGANLSDIQQVFSCTTCKMMERMTGNLVNIAQRLHDDNVEEYLDILLSGLEFTLTINPRDAHTRVMQARLWNYFNINLQESLDSLLSIPIERWPNLADEIRSLISRARDNLARKTQQDMSSAPTAKRREGHPEVEFCVGMIMKHRRYQYTCVIYGWDHQCQASEQWITQMGIHRLSRKQFQPFYNVMVADGSLRYAAAENLQFPDEFKEIPHPEIGKHFEEFTGTCYVPNAAKQLEYPDDCQRRAELLAEFLAQR